MTQCNASPLRFPFSKLRMERGAHSGSCLYCFSDHDGIGSQVPLLIALVVQSVLQA